MNWQGAEHEERQSVPKAGTEVSASGLELDRTGTSTRPKFQPKAQNAQATTNSPTTVQLRQGPEQDLKQRVCYSGSMILSKQRETRHESGALYVCTLDTDRKHQRGPRGGPGRIHKGQHAHSWRARAPAVIVQRKTAGRGYDVQGPNTWTLAPPPKSRSWVFPSLSAYLTPTVNRSWCEASGVESARIC